jgi:hypothetical protein
MFITDRLFIQYVKKGPHRPRASTHCPGLGLSIWLAKGAKVGPLVGVGTLRCEYGSATTFPNLLTASKLVLHNSDAKKKWLGTLFSSRQV